MSRKIAAYNAFLIGFLSALAASFYMFRMAENFDSPPGFIELSLLALCFPAHLFQSLYRDLFWSLPLINGTIYAMSTVLIVRQVQRRSAHMTHPQ